MIKKLVYKVARKYIYWVDGFSYDFKQNGEQWILAATNNLDLKVIFDVGANIGEWSKQAIKNFPKSNLHCFELSKTTYETLQVNITFLNASLNNVGLSNENSEIQYKDYGKNSGVNTLLVNATFHDKNIKPKMRRGKVIIGDDYCENNNIMFIDYLKVDVEGAEHLVFLGFSKFLAEKRIRIIQFEYGYTHGDAKFLMRDFYELLTQYGYIIGKLRKGRVEFKEWEYRFNDFDSGPNYIAIRESDKDLYHILSSN